MKLIRKCNRKSGFTLIEMVITVVVISLIAVPLSMLLFEHMRSLFISEDYVVATNLARLDLERMNNAAYDNVVSFSQSNYLGYNYDLNRNVTVIAGRLGRESLKEIQVDVMRAGEMTPVVTLKTYRAQNVSHAP